MFNAQYGDSLKIYPDKKIEQFFLNRVFVSINIVLVQ
jgi:hypothetical protein